MYKQKLLAFLGAIVALSAVGCSTQVTPENEDGTFGTTSAPAVAGWQEGSLLNHPRHSFTLTTLSDGRALATGGRGSDMVAYVGYLRSSELYNPTTCAWTLTGPLATERMEHASVRLPNNEVLVVGGYNDTYLATAERFNPTTGAWTPAGSMQAEDGLPRGRSWSTATLLTSGQVVVVGGWANGPRDQVDIFNTTTGTWTAGPSLPVARWGHGAVQLSSGLLVVGGFQHGETTATHSTELYTGASGGGSTAKGNLLTARGGHTTTLLPNGLVLVTGGRNGSGILTSAELYDPATGAWRTTGAMGTARYKHTATLVNGKVLVAGGVGPNDTPLSSTELYDPSTGTWSPEPALPWSRSLHTAALLDSVGKVLVTGGWGPQQYSPGNGYMRFTALYDAANVVVCNQPPNPSCQQATGTYTNGACVYPPKPAGTPCNDSKSCTVNDICDGAGTCGGTTSCSTNVEYFCASSTDVLKLEGTGTCNTSGTCGYTETFVTSCRRGGENVCSGNNVVVWSYYGCTSGSCASESHVFATCRTDLESYCSGNTVMRRQHTGCSGGNCLRTELGAVQTCPTGTSSVCTSSTTLQTTTSSGCSNGACVSSSSSQTCPTGTSSTCVTSTTLRTTTRSGCRNNACASSTSDTTCPTGTTYACDFLAGTDVELGRTNRYTSIMTTNSGCSGGACSASDTDTVCQHEERCTVGSTTQTGTRCVNYLSLGSNADFLTVSYRDVFEREAEPAGHRWWLCYMNGGCPDRAPYVCDDPNMVCEDEKRAEVLMQLLRSAESTNGRHWDLANFDTRYTTTEYKRAFIRALYNDVLQRQSRGQAAAETEITYWVDFLDSYNPQIPGMYKRLIYNFVASQEYRDRWIR